MDGLNIISAFRTAPHVDGEETRLRTVKLLLEALRADFKPVVAHLNIPIRIPGEKGVTSAEPVRSFYKRLPEGRPGSQKQDAVLKVGGVMLVLLSEHRAFTHPDHFKAVQIDPLAHKIVVVKEGYLFQGLRDIAPRAIMALTPGFANQTLENLEYHQLRRPVYPLDPDMEWTPNHTSF